MGGRAAQQGMQGFGASIGLHNIGRQARRTTSGMPVSPLRPARGAEKLLWAPSVKPKGMALPHQDPWPRHKFDCFL